MKKVSLGKENRLSCSEAAMLFKMVIHPIGARLRISEEKSFKLGLATTERACAKLPCKPEQCDAIPSIRRCPF